MREQIRALLEERDSQAAMLEAAEAEREILERQLEQARARLEEMERHSAHASSGHVPGETESTTDVEVEYDEEEAEEESVGSGDQGDDVDEMYVRMDDSRVRRRELDRERMDRESEAGDEPYWLVCPKCGDSLEEIETEDVKLERCESCGGIYMDRGEVEMLLLLGRGPRGLQRIRNVLMM